MVYSKVTAKPIKALLSSLLAVLLIIMSVPFTAMAAVDDFFEQGSLMFLVTSEESGSGDCTVMAAFNENLDPETITEIKVPGTVKHDGKTYSVTALTNSAFGSCTSLKSLDMSECTGLVSIGMSAFVDCEKLSSITIPCNFNKGLFRDTGIVTFGDSFRIEYVSLGNGDEGGGGSDVTETSGGTFTYVHNWGKDSSNAAQHKCSRCNKAEAHNWVINDKNYAEHKCTECSAKERHTWQPDAGNPKQHKCKICEYAEAHYGGNADCEGNANCAACGSAYKTYKPGRHSWTVMPETIGATSAEYECNTCQKVEEQKISSDANTVDVEGKKLKVILQDPYKVLPDGTQLSSKAVTPGSARHNELLGQMDNSDVARNLAFFDIELFKSDGKQISGQISGRVRILLQIPDGWDKRDLEAVLITDGDDIDFEESIITIDGTDYLGFWTNHFSPYALVEVSGEKSGGNGSESGGKNSGKTSPVTGNQDYAAISALTLASVAAVFIIFIVINRKRRIV